jgi:hypothetical protein
MKLKTIVSILFLLFLFPALTFGSTRLVGYEYVPIYDDQGQYQRGMCIDGQMSRVGLWKTYRAVAQEDGRIDFLRFAYISGPDTQLEWVAYKNNGNTPGQMIAHGLHQAVWNGKGEYDFSANLLSGTVIAGEYIWITVYVEEGDRVYTGRCGSLCLTEGDALKLGAQNLSYRPPYGSDFNVHYGPGCYAWSLWENGDQDPPPDPAYTDIQIADYAPPVRVYARDGTLIYQEE